MSTKIASQSSIDPGTTKRSEQGDSVVEVVNRDAVFTQINALLPNKRIPVRRGPPGQGSIHFSVVSFG
jgi:hypothetical protein